MMMKPALSIVMPMYNVANFIGKAIESVKQQTYDNWELIIVNDGSTDGSRDQAKAAIGGNPKIKIVDKPNGGLSDARNFGLSLSSGKYIHFFDSDDNISINFYKEMLSSVEHNNSDIIIGGYTVDTVSENDSIAYYKKSIPFFPPQTPLLLARFISSHFNFAWNKLFRRRFLTDHNLTFEKGLSKIEDCEFMSRVITLKPKIVFCETTGYHYRNDVRPTLSKTFDESTLLLSKRRIHCSRQSFINLGYSGNMLEQALDFIRFNTIRSMLHGAFTNSHNISRTERYRTVKKIVETNELTITNGCCMELSYIDKVLWYLIRHHLSYIVYCLYAIKS